MTDSATEIQALQNMSQPDLVAHYEATFGHTPPITRRAWLWRRFAWKLQEQRFGGLSKTAQRRLRDLTPSVQLLADREPHTVHGQLLRPGKHRALQVGSALERTWHGQHIRVLVVQGGFEWDDTVYRSLTAVAEAVTGAHWNGRAFFGLAKMGSRR